MNYERPGLDLSSADLFPFWLKWIRLSKTGEHEIGLVREPKKLKYINFESSSA